jgi:hypothetical protein
MQMVLNTYLTTVRGTVICSSTEPIQGYSSFPPPQLNDVTAVKDDFKS